MDHGHFLVTYLNEIQASALQPRLVSFTNPWVSHFDGLNILHTFSSNN